MTMQQMSPETRSLVSLSDIPLTFSLETQVCHPTEKKPSGERMAYAAQGLVYGKNDFVGVSTLKSYEIKGSDVFVTLDNVGDTLKVKGTKIYGFTACGKDGVFLPADAEIISEDTVKVTCEEIKTNEKKGTEIINIIMSNILPALLKADKEKLIKYEIDDDKMIIPFNLIKCYEKELNKKQYSKDYDIYCRCRILIDYVSGMTDSYAEQISKK